MRVVLKVGVPLNPILRSLNLDFYSEFFHTNDKFMGNDDKLINDKRAMINSLQVPTISFLFLFGKLFIEI